MMSPRSKMLLRVLLDRIRKKTDSCAVESKMEGCVSLNLMQSARYSTIYHHWLDAISLQPLYAFGLGHCGRLLLV